MLRGHVLFTNIELCNIVLTILHFNFASAFWASKGAGHFPICMKSLKEDLKLVTSTYAVTAKLVAQIEQGIPQATHKLDAKVKMRSPDDQIPKKSKGKFSQDQPGGSKKNKEQKLYQHCSQWSPNSMYTHITADCCKWNADGTQKFKPNKRGNYKNSNAHAMDGLWKRALLKCAKTLKRTRRRSSSPRRAKISLKGIMIPLTLAMALTWTRMMGLATIVLRLT